MSEMVNRVADALVKGGKAWLRETGGDSLGWSDVPDEVFAISAIEAMREPTEAMISKAMQDDHTDMPMARGYDEVWKSMIDEALK